MSRDLHRDKMPNYLLQWEAMRWSKAAGCTRLRPVGRAGRLDPHDPMWGVFRFKEGLRRTTGAHAGRLGRHLPSCWTYRLYHSVLPALLGLMRRRGRAATRQSLE